MTDSEIVIEVRPEQPEKAELPMLVTELGIVIDVRPEQPLKAFSPMCFIDSGIVIEVRPEQPENAEPAIPLVPSFMLIFVFVGIEPLYSYRKYPIYTNPSDCFSYHFVELKAPVPMFVIEFGIVMEES